MMLIWSRNACVCKVINFCLSCSNARIAEKLTQVSLTPGIHLFESNLINLAGFPKRGHYKVPQRHRR